MSTHRSLSAAIRRAVLFAAGAMFLATVSVAHAQEEPKVKAAFLLRFAQFVSWPQDALPQPNTPLAIGIVGAEEIAAELTQQAAGSRATIGRPVSVRHVKTGDDVPALHLLFVGADASSRIAQLAAATRGRRVLLVTESAGALDQGSMINFVIAERRVKFEIALDAAEKAGLVLSSRLLAVAMRVLKGELPAPVYPVAGAPPAAVLAGARR